MKSIALIALAAAFSLGASASARTVTAPVKNANDQSVEAVAGPAPANKVASATDDKSSAHPVKKALKKSKGAPPPPMHDGN